MNEGEAGAGSVHHCCCYGYSTPLRGLLWNVQVSRGAAGQCGKSNAAVIDRTISSSGIKNQGQRGFSYPPSLRTGLTFRPLGGGPTMQPQHHGGKGHLALHTVLPDGIDDSSWEVDVEVAEEDDAVWVLGTDVGRLTDPLDQGGGQAILWDNLLSLSQPNDKLPQNKLLGRFPWCWASSTVLTVREWILTSVPTLYGLQGLWTNAPLSFVWFHPDTGPVAQQRGLPHARPTPVSLLLPPQRADSFTHPKCLSSSSPTLITSITSPRPLTAHLPSPGLCQPEVRPSARSFHSASCTGSCSERKEERG